MANTRDEIPDYAERARRLGDLIAAPEAWLDTKNEQLGGEKPRDLIGTSREPVLRNLLEAIEYGSFS